MTRVAVAVMVALLLIAATPGTAHSQPKERHGAVHGPLLASDHVVAQRRAAVPLLPLRAFGDITSRDFTRSPLAPAQPTTPAARATVPVAGSTGPATGHASSGLPRHSTPPGPVVVGEGTTTGPRAWTPPWLRIAACESSGHWADNTGNGYYGGLQEDMNFWHSYGDQRYARPDLAPMAAQIAAATKARDGGRGYKPWPVCGARA